MKWTSENSSTVMLFAAYFKEIFSLWIVKQRANEYLGLMADCPLLLHHVEEYGDDESSCGPLTL